MAVKFYLEKRLNKQGEAPIRCSVMVRGKRLLTTTGYSIAPEYWNAYFPLTEEIKRCFDEHGVAMTFNHLNVHILDK